MNSPQILLLSGIGPKKHLESVGVPVVLNLPGVEQNFHDHPGTPITYTVNEPDTYIDNWKVASQYLEDHTGPMSGTETISVVGVLASDLTKPNFPDTQLFFVGYIADCATGKVGALKSKGKRSMIIVASYTHPKSKGSVTLASKDPFEYPILQVRYLADPEDLKGQVEAIKVIQALTKTKILKSYNFTMVPVEACSSLKIGSDKYFACVAQQDNYALCHFAGSCKMGPASNPLAVVDPRLKVHGIKGLRVADASIMPQVSSANTATPTIMIGERAAIFIKKDWSKKGK